MIKCNLFFQEIQFLCYLNISAGNQKINYGGYYFDDDIEA